MNSITGKSPGIHADTNIGMKINVQNICSDSHIIVDI